MQNCNEKVQIFLRCFTMNFTLIINIKHLHRPRTLKDIPLLQRLFVTTENTRIKHFYYCLSMVCKYASLFADGP